MPVGLAGVTARLGLCVISRSPTTSLLSDLGIMNVLPMMAFTPALMQISVVSRRFAGSSVVKRQLLLLPSMRASTRTAGLVIVLLRFRSYIGTGRCWPVSLWPTCVPATLLSISDCTITSIVAALVHGKLTKDLRSVLWAVAGLLDENGPCC